MKKFELTALLLGGVLLLSGCDSAEQKAENEKNLRRAEENAVTYIEEKYGFTPEVIESVLERQSGLFGSTPDTTALIRMSYNNKEFSVYINGETVNNDGADNYQQEEIISAITEEFSAVAENAKGIIGSDIKSVNINGGKADDFFPDVDWDAENLYSEYFNGENFAEVFGDEICDITVNYVNADLGCLYKEDFSFILGNKRTRLGLISYRSENDYSERPEILDFTQYLDIEKHAIQIEESLVFEKNERRHCEYTLGKYDNFYYYASENKTDQFSFIETTLPDVKNWSGHGVINGEFLTHAYRIDDGVKERIYIFYPLSELSGGARIATYTKNSEGEDFYISPLADDIGDYRMVYISSFDFKDVEEKSLAFIDEKEKTEDE